MHYFQRIRYFCLTCINLLGKLIKFFNVLFCDGYH